MSEGLISCKKCGKTFKNEGSLQAPKNARYDDS